MNSGIEAAVWGVIILLGIYDAVTYWTDQGRKHVSLKGEMTGVGILGTFIGIFIGLQEFDVHDISGSIPQLLEGLKTAFRTSIVGLVCSTGLTVVQAIKPVSFRKTGDPVADTLVRVFQEFEPLMADLRDANRQNSVEIVAMRTTMESTMLELRKGVTAEIIGALEKVIADFNSNLQEQFGDNFRRLNEACFKLVEWQEGYLEKIKAATDMMRDAAAAHKLLRAQSEAMLSRHQELLNVLSGVGVTAGELSLATQRLSEAVAQAVKQVQRVESGLDGIRARAGEAESAARTALEAVLAEFSSAVAATSKAAATAFAGVRSELDHLKNVTPALAIAAKEAAAAATSATAAATAAGRTTEEAGRSVTLTHEQLTQSVVQLDQALAALTNQFADAFRNYLDGLRRLAEDE